MLGLYDDDHLVGVASFSYRYFASEDETKAFCEKSWSPFYSEVMPEVFNTAIVYNVEILPSKRGEHYVHYLLNQMMKRAFDDGCQSLIGIGRVPSYNGDRFNGVRHKPELKEAIESYFSSGVYPPEDILLKDPLIALYKKIGGCRVLAIIKDYMPEDEASGGIRAIVYTKLAGQWKKELSKGSL